MSIKAVGILADKIVPIGIVRNVMRRFPQHHLYLINNSFPMINQMHQYNLQ